MSKNTTPNIAKRAYLDEIDATFQRLVTHFAYDFEAIAHSFRRYLKFMETIYPRVVNEHVDITAFDAKVCRARYAASDFKRHNNRKPNNENVLTIKNNNNSSLNAVRSSEHDGRQEYGGCHASYARGVNSILRYDGLDVSA